MSDDFKPLGADLGGVLSTLQKRVEAHQELTTQVRAALDMPEKDHVVSASCREDILIVLADSAAWSARIHYRQGDLLQRLRAAGETRFTKVKVAVGRERL